jgi:deoxyribose-phosphate aldolase
MDPRQLASHLEHTLLRPEATRTDIERACQLSQKLGCAAVCINPIWVPLASQLLSGSGVRVVAVVGFPFGATGTAVKVLETQRAVGDGADEIDMVLAIGQLKDGGDAYVVADIAAVVRAADGRPVKVVLECGLLSDDEKRRAVDLAATGGAAYVKTSTGFLGSGATLHDVTLLHRAAGGRLAVKATGGIRFFEDAVALLEAGASRLGSSHSQSLLASGAG